MRFNSRVAHSEPLHCPARIEPKYYVKETIQLSAEMDLIHILIRRRRRRVDGARPPGRGSNLKRVWAAFSGKAASDTASATRPSQDNSGLQTLRLYPECN